MTQDVKQCPICGYDSFSTFLEGKDYFLTGETFSVLICEKCGFRITDPIPIPEQMSKYYESKEYISHDTEEKSLINRVYKLARFFTLKEKRKIVEKNSKGKRLLDIGCGTGEFLAQMKGVGYDCFGVEPNEKARAYAKTKYDLPVIEELRATEFEQGTFNCITLWHVLEHIPDLNGTFKTLKELLKPSGMLIVALPNPHSWDAKYYRHFWAAYDLPRHLYHFSSKNISDLAEKYGFKMKKIIPQCLDAFYISLLSEKYKSGKKDPVMGTIIGLWSNFNARKSFNGYSSHIYLLSPEFS